MSQHPTKRRVLWNIALDKNAPTVVETYIGRPISKMWQLSLLFHCHHLDNWIFLSTCGKCAFPSILQDTKDDYCCKPLVSKVCMSRISGISSPPTCSLDSQNLPSTRFRVTISSSTYPTSYDHHLHPRSCYSLWKVHNLVENCIRCFLNKWRMQQWHMWFNNYTYTHNV